MEKKRSDKLWEKNVQKNDVEKTFKKIIAKKTSKKIMEKKHRQ